MEWSVFFFGVKAVHENLKTRETFKTFSPLAILPFRTSNRRVSPVNSWQTGRFATPTAWCKELNRRFSGRKGRKATSVQTHCRDTQAKDYFYKCTACLLQNMLLFFVFLDRGFQKSFHCLCRESTVALRFGASPTPLNPIHPRPPSLQSVSESPGDDIGEANKQHV